jgi:hypothetical protein
MNEMKDELRDYRNQRRQTEKVKKKTLPAMAS